MVHCTNRQKHSKPLVYQSSQVYRNCTNSVPTMYQSSKTVKTAKMTIGVPIVTGLPRLYKQCNNSVPIVKNSQKQSNSKKMTIGVPIVTCLHRVRRMHKAAQTPLFCETSITCAWAVATARRPWAGLTVICVYMDVHASGSRSLPRAATLSSTY